MPERILEIENISIAYDNKIVMQNFSLQLNKGKHIAVVGASGCGKSSMLKAILGFIPVTQGKILYNGTEISYSNIYNIRNSIAYLPQDITFPCEWIREIVDIIFRIKANNSTYSKEKLCNYFKELGLEEDIFDKRVSEISGGQRQRVMLAIVALTAKELILLDEPTSALDKESAQLTLNFLKTLDSRPAIISVTHDCNFAQHCDKIISL